MVRRWDHLGLSSCLSMVKTMSDDRKPTLPPNDGRPSDAMQKKIDAYKRRGGYVRLPEPEPPPKRR